MQSTRRTYTVYVRIEGMLPVTAAVVMQTAGLFGAISKPQADKSTAQQFSTYSANFFLTR